MDETMTSTEKSFSPVAQSVCEVCSLLWLCIVFGVCTYLVFWMNQSGWWYALAVFLASGWTCKWLASPEQIRARKDVEDED